MKKTGKRLDHTKEKIAGDIKVVAGKITGNEQLGLKGKIQSTKADLKLKVDDIQDNVANAINHAFDKKGEKVIK